jgi:hypothetical protein
MAPNKKTKGYKWEGEIQTWVLKCIDGMGLAAGTIPTREQFYEQIYDPAPDALWPDIATYPKYRIWGNVQNNLKKFKKSGDGWGARKAKAKARSHPSPANKKTQERGAKMHPAMAPSSKAAKTPKTPSAATASTTTALAATPKKNLIWETVHSYWKDKDNNDRLQFFVVLPSGCRPEDMMVAVAKDGTYVQLLYYWPDALFDAERAFEGQTNKYGTGVATKGSSKAEGLEASIEYMKNNNKSRVKTELKFFLETQVEATLIDYDGSRSKKCRFYKIVDEEWEQYPTVFVCLGLMVKRADSGFGEEKEEQQDIE